MRMRTRIKLPEQIRPHLLRVQSGKESRETAKKNGPLIAAMTAATWNQPFAAPRLGVGLTFGCPAYR